MQIVPLYLQNSNSPGQRWKYSIKVKDNKNSEIPVIIFFRSIIPIM